MYKHYRKRRKRREEKQGKIDVVIVIIVYSLPQAGQSSKHQSFKRNDIAHTHAVTGHLATPPLYHHAHTHARTGMQHLLTLALM